MSNPTKLPDSLLLSDLIRAVKAEIAVAIEEKVSKNEKPMFSLGEVVLEVNFTIQTKRTAKGGFKANLLAIGVNAGGDVDYSKEQVHKVTVHLAPYQNPQATDKPAMQPFGFPSSLPAGGSDYTMVVKR